MVNATLRPLYPRESPGTHCTRGWLGPRAGLDVCRNSHPPTGCDPGPSNPVAQSLYRLSYRAHLCRLLSQLKYQDTWCSQQWILCLFTFPLNCINWMCCGTRRPGLDYVHKRYLLHFFSPYKNSCSSSNTSARESLVMHEWKQNKPCCDKECVDFLDQRKQAKMQWIQDPSRNNVDNLNNVRFDASRHFRNK